MDVDEDKVCYLFYNFKCKKKKGFTLYIIRKQKLNSTKLLHLYLVLLFVFLFHMSIAMGRIKPESIGGAVECGGLYKAKKMVEEEEDVEEDWCSSSSTSSIGKNSDLSGRSTEEEESEVQSCYKGPPSPSLVMDSLEEALPIR